MRILVSAATGFVEPALYERQQSAPGACVAADLRDAGRLLVAANVDLQSLLLGRCGLVRRLCSSLSVDIGKDLELMGWSPPFSSDQVLRQTALDFLGQEAR